MARLRVEMDLEVADDRVDELTDGRLGRYFELALERIDVSGAIAVTQRASEPAPEVDEHAEAPSDAAPDAVAPADESPAPVDTEAVVPDADTRELEALSAAAAGAEPQPEPVPHAEPAEESQAYRAAQARKAVAANAAANGGTPTIRVAPELEAQPDAGDDDEPLDLPDDDGDGDEGGGLDDELPDVTAIVAEETAGGDGPAETEETAAADGELPPPPEGVAPEAWYAAQARKRRQRA